MLVRKLALPLVLLALALAAPTAAHAAALPLMKGLENPGQLADLIEDSLKEDAEGNGLLDAEHCTKSDATRCATPNHYFDGIRKDHPESKIGSVAELPMYLRSLEARPGLPGRWRMSRLLVAIVGDTVNVRYDAEGWSRAFRQGENAWVDINTGEQILAGDCGNVVGALIAPPRLVVRKRPPRPRRPVAFAAPPPAPLAPPPAFYRSSRPDFGTFPRAVCPPEQPRCRKQGGF